MNVLFFLCLIILVYNIQFIYSSIRLYEFMKKILKVNNYKILSLIFLKFQLALSIIGIKNTKKE